MWFRKKTELPYKEGLIQATQVFGYVLLFALFISKAESMFPNIKPPYGPVLMLTLFCFSVMTCGLIVFYKPYLLFVDKKGKEAGQLILTTTKWLGVYVVIAMVFVAVMTR